MLELKKEVIKYDKSLILQIYLHLRSGNVSVRVIKNNEEGLYNPLWKKI